MNALGIVGLGGSVAEWTLESFRPYDHACWRASRQLGAHCWEAEAPARVVRGGSWISVPATSVVVGRSYQAAGYPLTGNIGFRCAYEVPSP